MSDESGAALHRRVRLSAFVAKAGYSGRDFGDGVIGAQVIETVTTHVRGLTSEQIQEAAKSACC